MQVPQQKLFCFHCWPSRPEAKKKQSFAASCVVNRHPQMTAGRNRANALPAVPPVRFLLLPCDWKCWIHFLWFQTPPEENLLRPATEELCCCFRLSSRFEARGQWKRGRLEKEGKIYFAFKCLEPFMKCMTWLLNNCQTQHKPLRQLLKASYFDWRILLWGWVGSDYFTSCSNLVATICKN